MPFDGRAPLAPQDRNLLIAHALLQQQDEADQEFWESCLYGGLRREGVVPQPRRYHPRYPLVAAALGVSDEQAGHLTAGCDIARKRRIVAAEITARGLRSERPTPLLPRPRRPLPLAQAMLAGVLVAQAGVLIWMGVGIFG